jgi:hypothetical protein
VYVHTLVAVETLKEKAVWPWNIPDRWHISCPNEL